MAEADCPGTTFAVDRGHWSNLSAEFADLVAPPITISSSPGAGAGAADEPVAPARQAQRARSRANMPLERHRQPTR
jgi:hypothetical protein